MNFKEYCEMIKVATMRMATPKNFRSWSEKAKKKYLKLHPAAQKEYLAQRAAYEKHKKESLDHSDKAYKTTKKLKNNDKATGDDHYKANDAHNKSYKHHMSAAEKAKNIGEHESADEHKNFAALHRQQMKHHQIIGGGLKTRKPGGKNHLKETDQERAQRMNGNH